MVIYAYAPSYKDPSGKGKKEIHSFNIVCGNEEKDGVKEKEKNND